MVDRHHIPKNFPDRYLAMYEGKRTKVITFIVTHQCNLRCKYCYEHSKSDAKMDFETAKKGVDLLFRDDERKTDIINDEVAHGVILEFMGGEPLLEIDLINKIVEYFLNIAIEKRHRWAVNYYILISTNGVLGDDPRVKQFIKKYDGRLTIGVTIDGDKEAHDSCRVDCNGCGSYDRAIKMFKEVTDSDGNRNTKYTIAPGNLSIFYRSVKHMIEDGGVSEVYCNYVYEKGWTIDHARELYNQLKNLSDYARSHTPYVYISMLDWEVGEHMPDTETSNWCGGNARMIAFDVDGSIIPCTRFSEVSLGGNREPYYIGDVNVGIGVREKDAARLEVLRSITRQSQSTQECLDCPINQGCSWCTAYNYEETGTPNKRVTYTCDMHKARVLAQCYHHNMMHLQDISHEPKAMYIPREWAEKIIGKEEYENLRTLERKVLGSNAVQP